ncbi:MAG TPA: ATP-binding cassette domain-containing protein [Conexibacter sp.]
MTHVERAHDGTVPGLLEARNICKRFGSVSALDGVSLSVHRGKVTCLLGDNGAGKSTLIKVLGGVHRPDRGELLIDGEPVTFKSPRDALDAGIATVFQDLAMIPLMGIERNFFLGREPTRGRGPLRRFDHRHASDMTRRALADIGIHLRDTSRMVGTLSGGERQAIAIARAVHFGARVLILDEPTSALGVKEAAVVLRYIARARQQGLGIVFITHNIQHAFLLGDQFTVLNRGRTLGELTKGAVTRDELETMMAGGEELSELRAELGGLLDEPPSSPDSPHEVRFG